MSGKNRRQQQVLGGIRSALTRRPAHPQHHDHLAFLFHEPTMMPQGSTGADEDLKKDLKTPISGCLRSSPKPWLAPRSSAKPTWESALKGNEGPRLGALDVVWVLAHVGVIVVETALLAIRRRVR